MKERSRNPSISNRTPTVAPPNRNRNEIVAASLPEAVAIASRSIAFLVRLTTLVLVHTDCERCVAEAVAAVVGPQSIPKRASSRYSDRRRYSSREGKMVRPATRKDLHLASCSWLAFNGTVMKLSLPGAQNDPEGRYQHDSIEIARTSDIRESQVLLFLTHWNILFVSHSPLMQSQLVER